MTFKWQFRSGSWFADGTAWMGGRGVARSQMAAYACADGQNSLTLPTPTI